MLRCLTLATASALLLCACSNDEPTGPDDTTPTAGKADGEIDVLTCDATTWLDPVPVAGSAIMAYQGSAYVFARDGRSWSVVHGETASTEPLPLPEGIVEMKNVKVEMSPSGRNLVLFTSEGDQYAAFFDGDGFVRTTDIGPAKVAHADAAERIHALESTGLVVYEEGEDPIFRGNLIETPLAWTVDAEGTVHVFLQRRISRGRINRLLAVRQLPATGLSWSGDHEVATNVDWGFSGLKVTAAQDGSVHAAYALTSSTYYYRSHDGESWEELFPSDIITEARLVDQVHSDLKRVRGGLMRVDAQDYDHASLTLGSGVYHLRNCEPYDGLRGTWPADRLSGQGLMAVDEQGLATIVTDRGARQQALAEFDPCPGGCDLVVPEDPAPELELPDCREAEVFGPIETPVDLQAADGYGEPLMVVGDAARVNIGGTPYWMEAELGVAQTLPRPDLYADADALVAHTSVSGGRTVVFSDGGRTYVAANDAVAIEAPCDAFYRCEARVAGDGHVWVATPDLHEQVGAGFEARGAPPVTAAAWDVDAEGNVLVASVNYLHADDYVTVWRLRPGALGWSRLGTLSSEAVQEVSDRIEYGWDLGGIFFAQDGSLHVYSSARSIGTGTHNRAQYAFRTRDYDEWEVEELPTIETLAGNDNHVGWRYHGFWAASYDRVRYIVMTSDKPIYNGWNWRYPSFRQLNVVERCRNEEGDIGFATVATMRHPGWTTPGFSTFSRSGVATTLTADGLSQVP